MYGALCDIWGAWKPTLLLLGMAAGAALCFVLLQNQLPLLYLASLLYGCVYALSMVGLSRCCTAAYGEQECKRYLGLHTSITNGIGAGFSLLSGLLYDSAQSFTPVLLVVVAVITVSILAVLHLSAKRPAAVYNLGYFRRRHIRRKLR